MLERLELLVGSQNINKIKTTKVLVVGVGGVGGYVVESLVRSGVGSIVLIDYEKLDITNKNRQIIALDSTIGEKKVDAFEKRILDINKECKVIKYDTFLTEDNIDIIEKERPDYVVDACDTITTKKAIIKKCLELNIKLISSMGTGNKLDPSKLEISDIRKTSYDPIAKILRKWISDEHINDKVIVLSSKEPPIKTGSRVVASTSFVPSSAGLLISSYIIRNIIEN